MVVYTVTNPAIPPIPNVIALGSCWPGLAVPCTNCLRVTYVVNRTAEFAPWRIIWNGKGAKVEKEGENYH